jgi:SAM-dependent methyltransferase/Flp pilus assembly protein TadD
MLTEDKVQLDEIIRQAETAFQAGDYRTAERWLTEALSQCPQRVDLMFLLGHTHMECQDFEAGLTCYTDIAAVAPNLSLVHSSRALALQLLGRPAEARTAAERALQLDLNDPVALKVLARIHINAGDGVTARQHCARLLALDAQDNQARHFLTEAERLCRKDLAQNVTLSPTDLDSLQVTPLNVAMPIAESPKINQDADWQEEIDFWDSELSLKGIFVEDMTKRIREPEKVFPHDVTPYIEELRKKHGRVPRVLDAGSGPLPYLSYGHQCGMMDLIGADPLAEVYLKLLAKHGHKPTAPLVKCAGEELTRVFGTEAFDFIYMKNALDHAQSPREVFRQMVQALRPGGCIYILGTVKEATRQNWAGLHQHNLYSEPGGRLMDEHKCGGKLVAECISDGYGLEVVKASPPTSVCGGWVSIIWRKPDRTAASENGQLAGLVKCAEYVGGAWKDAPYYDEAELRISREWSEMVWPFIQDCDFSVVLDLAAGHGRNSEKLRGLAQKIYLVDINEENIAFCRRRFAGDERFVFYRNNGVTLEQIPDNSLSLVYSFDAMVHFDSDVVRHYLKEFRRILRPGGRGFCHHSNTVKYPGADVHTNPGWRNFMSQPLFAHYCAKEGLNIIRWRILDWGGRPESDCFSLFEKR